MVNISLTVNLWYWHECYYHDHMTMQLCRPLNDIKISTSEFACFPVFFMTGCCSDMVPGHLYPSQDFGYGRTLWQVADPGLCVSVILMPSSERLCQVNVHVSLYHYQYNIRVSAIIVTLFMMMKLSNITLMIVKILWIMHDLMTPW